MFEMILSVGLYAGIVFLLVRGAVLHCNDNSHDDMVTEP